MIQKFKMLLNNTRKGKHSNSICNFETAIIKVKILISEDDKMNSYLGPFNFNH